LPDATARLLEAVSATGETLAYGDLGAYDPAILDPLRGLAAPEGTERVGDGLARFIANCPSNSSTILVSAERYRQAGRCGGSLVPPDQALFLRLFARGGGVKLNGPVALAPHTAPGRLSGQRRRSRYESVLALYHLVTETPGLSRAHARLACHRAAARA